MLPLQHVMKLQKLAQSYYISRIKALSLISKRKAAKFAFDIFCWPFTRMKYEPTGYLQNAEQLQMNFDGLKTIGYRWNKGGSKKIYIAHGFRSSAANFTHFAKKFLEKGYEVVAFDAPGHGLSEGKRITAIVYKRFIEQLNLLYGPFDGYVCHSFGGLAVSFAVAEMPGNDRIKIALVAPASDTKSLADEFIRQMKMADKKLQQYFFEEIENLGQNKIEWFTIKRSLETINGKVLWVHDEEDNITPVKDAHFVQGMNFPNVEFVFTNGLGHRKIYRDGSVVEQIVDFL